jgi:endonuclease III
MAEASIVQYIFYSLMSQCFDWVIVFSRKMGQSQATDCGECFTHGLQQKGNGGNSFVAIDQHDFFVKHF